MNQEFERVFYKNNLAAGVGIFNIYMVGFTSVKTHRDLADLMEDIWGNKLGQFGSPGGVYVL